MSAGNSSVVKSRWDHRKLGDPLVRKQFQDALATLPIPRWEVSADQRNKLFESQVLKLAQQHFSLQSKPLKERPLLSQHTLDLIGVKRQLLKLLRSSVPADVDYLRSQVKDLERTIRPLVRQDQRAWYDNWLCDTQHAFEAHDSKAMFAKLLRLGRRKDAGTGPRPLPMMQASDGTRSTTFEQSQHILSEQFRLIEAGQRVPPADLVAASQALPALDAELDLGLLPTVQDVWRLIARCKNGKAAGPNQLVNEIFKAGGINMAHHILPLFLKAVLTGQEPLAWHGGSLFALYKGKGSPSLPDSFRSIFLSNVQAKLYHSWIRTKLEELWHRRASSMQYGGRKGHGTDMAHHVVQSVLAAARSNGHSSALMFLDLKAAFYTVQRAMLFDEHASDEVLCQVMQEIGVTPDVWQQIVATTDNDHALQGLTPHVEHVVRNLMHGTFFTMPAISCPIATHRGTRPGDPIGDILFNLAFSLVLADARTMFEATCSDAVWVGDPLPWVPGTEVALPPTFFAEIAFVDDVVQIIYTDKVDRLLPLLQCLAACTHDAAAKRGLDINYGSGKTEALFQPRGLGSKAVKHLVRNQMAHQIPVVTENGAQSLRLVDQYKRLGTYVQLDAITARDRRHRIAMAKQAAGQLHRSFFTKKAISVAAKQQVFSSLVLSRLMYNVHVWSWITEKELSTWADGLRYAVRPLAQGSLRGGALPCWPAACSEVAIMEAYAWACPHAALGYVGNLQSSPRMVRSAPTVLCLVGNPLSAWL